MPEISPLPLPSEIWLSLAFCGRCGSAAPLREPCTFLAPPNPFAPDGRRQIWGALYFRDPFHPPFLPFENYCSAACGLARYDPAGSATRKALVIPKTGNAGAGAVGFSRRADAGVM